MNYKTTLVATAIAVAAIAALGSALPMVGTAFAQISLPPLGDENSVNSCTGTVSGTNADCRNQGNQVGRENTQGDVTFED